jgi:hypothetical protein
MSKCLNCNKENKKEKHKFCSLSCSASFNNKGIRRNSIPNKSYEKIKCFTCKTLTSNKKYCSHSCQQEYQRNKINESIINGSYIGAMHNTKYLKAFLIDLREHKCEECKNTEWLNNPINLELEHINGDSSDNNLINLKLLCPNCHSYTPTYKGKNIGNSKRERGRYYKRKIAG